MYILCLRPLPGDKEPMAIAHSDTEQKLWDYVEHYLDKPRMDVVEGKRVVRYFQKGSELEDYMPHDPRDDRTGVIRLGTLDERVQVILEATRPTVIEKVKEEIEKIVAGTVKV